MYKSNVPPRLINNFIGRKRELRELLQFWNSDDPNVLVITAPGGSGKTAIVQKFISQLDPELNRIFFWSFYDNENISHFFEEIYAFITGRSVDNNSFITDKFDSIINGLSVAGNFLIVLDGLEVIQQRNGSKYGFLINSQLEKFIRLIEQGIGKVKCIITSRISVHLSTDNYYQELSLEGLSENDALKLLSFSSSNLPEVEAREFVQNYSRHPLLLKLASNYFNHSGKLPSEAQYDFRISVNEVLKAAISTIAVEQKDILEIISLFPEGINAVLVESVYQYVQTKKGKTSDFDSNNTEIIEEHLGKLLKRGLVYFLQEESYTVHPVIRDYLKSFHDVGENDSSLNQFESINSDLKENILNSIFAVLTKGNINNEQLELLLSRLKGIKSEAARLLETMLESVLSIDLLPQEKQLENERPKVFVSYVREDQELVKKLRSELEKNNIDIWQDTDKLLPGDRWKNKIREAIQNGDYFLACFSTKYWAKRKTYMNEELSVAIDELRLRPTERLWFIPVLLDECEIPDRPIGSGETLRDIHNVELYPLWEEGIMKIVKAIFSGS